MFEAEAKQFALNHKEELKNCGRRWLYRQGDNWIVDIDLKHIYHLLKTFMRQNQLDLAKVEFFRVEVKTWIKRLHASC